MKNILLHLIIILLILPVSSAYANKFHDSDKRELDLHWKVKGNALKVWGGVTGGSITCKQLNYKIRFENSISNRIAYVHGFIKNYRPNGRNTFSIDDELYKQSKKFKRKSDKKSFYVSDFRTKCLN